MFDGGSDFWLADGFHRRLAAVQLGLVEIDAEVHQGTVRDARWHSFSVMRLMATSAIRGTLPAS
jgi:hypothetical protein